MWAVERLETGSTVFTGLLCSTAGPVSETRGSRLLLASLRLTPSRASDEKSTYHQRLNSRSVATKRHATKSQWPMSLCVHGRERYQAASSFARIIGRKSEMVCIVGSNRSFVIREVRFIVVAKGPVPDETAALGLSCKYQSISFQVPLVSFFRSPVLFCSRPQQ